MGRRVCRLTLSRNGDVGQGVLIWGLNNFDDKLVGSYPKKFTEP